MAMADEIAANVATKLEEQRKNRWKGLATWAKGIAWSSGVLIALATVATAIHTWVT